jgi:hypothetical protein
MSGSDKPAKRSWVDKVLRRGRGKGELKQGKPGIDQGLFLLANEFGDLMRDKSYADLPDELRRQLRQPVEQAIESKDQGKTRTAIDTFKEDVKKAGPWGAAQPRREVAEAQAKTLKDRGSPGAGGVAKILADMKASADKGDFDKALVALGNAEAAILNDLKAHIGLAQGRINSLSDWGATDAPALDRRVKALDVGASLATFDATFRGYDDLMRDVAGAANVPIEEQKSRAFVELRKGIVAGIATLGEGDTKKDLQKRLDDWDKAVTEADKQKDPAKKKTAQDALDDTAEQLLKDVMSAGGMNKADKEKVYAKALEARFGFQVKITDDATYDYSNLDKLYEVLKMVPPEDVKQASLKILKYEAPAPYDPRKEGAGYGSRGALIEMGNYGAGTSTWPYTNPDGTPAPANGFSISALHELGHSVDDRHGIMAGNQGKSGCGTWTSESVASVTDVCYGAFKDGPGKDLGLDEGVVRGLIQTCLGGTVPTKPDTITDPHWGTLATTLNQCLAMLEGRSPWNNAGPVTIGARAYHQAYKQSNEWWSYDPGSRGGTTVRPYQWRSPAEWFAELYAFTNYKKQKPPGGIDAGVAVFMYKS